jgi:hypothetical protein
MVVKSKQKEKKSSVPSLKSKAKSNAMVSKVHGKEKEVVKEGIPLDHTDKCKPVELTGAKVGMSIGSTINMGDFESLRVDVWLSDTLQEDESERDGFNRIQLILQEVIQEVVDEFSD